MPAQRHVSASLAYKELLWFLRGQTDTTWLHEQGVKIWDGNSSREFLDRRGLTDYAEGQLGPVYGWQWRHFGADWRAQGRGASDSKQEQGLCCGGGGGSGVDQIAQIVEGLRRDPFGRRHVLSAWNPVDLPKMALPPCHLMAVFHVDAVATSATESKNQLSCHLFMRSNDMFHGHPYNVCCYSLLTHMLARLTGMQAGQLAITATNCHLYAAHDAAVDCFDFDEEPLGYPRLLIRDRPYASIDDFGPGDLTIGPEYATARTIQVPMVV